MIIIDPPPVEAHGRVWSHLASDTSHEELHTFARRIGVPERGFDGDHYDVPSEWYDEVVAAGATPVSSRELVTRLTRAGLRRPKPRTLLPRPTGRALLRPSRLRSGDLVAVVSPAGPTRPDRLDAGVAVLESWGLRVRVEPAGEAREPWLAGDDAHRAAAFTRRLGRPGRGGGVDRARWLRHPADARPPRLGRAGPVRAQAARRLLRRHRPAPGRRDAVGPRHRPRPRGGRARRRRRPTRSPRCAPSSWTAAP